MQLLVIENFGLAVQFKTAGIAVGEGLLQIAAFYMQI